MPSSGSAADPLQPKSKCVIAYLNVVRGLKWNNAALVGEVYNGSNSQLPARPRWLRMRKIRPWPAQQHHRPLMGHPNPAAKPVRPCATPVT